MALVIEKKLRLFQNYLHSGFKAIASTYKWTGFSGNYQFFSMVPFD